MPAHRQQRQQNIAAGILLLASAAAATEWYASTHFVEKIPRRLSPPFRVVKLEKTAGRPRRREDFLLLVGSLKAATGFGSAR